METEKNDNALTEEQSIDIEKKKLDEKIMKIEKERDELFLEEYRVLCDKHGRHLSAEIRLREGKAPVTWMFVERER